MSSQACTSTKELEALERRRYRNRIAQRNLRKRRRIEAQASGYNEDRERRTLFDCPNSSMNVSEQIQQEQQKDPKHAGHLGTSSFVNDSDSPPQLLDDAFDSRSFLTSPDLGLNEFDFGNWDTTQTPASSCSGPEISAQPAIEGPCLPRSSDFSSTSTDACQLLQSVDIHPKGPLALQTQQTQKNFTRHYSTPCSSVASSKTSKTKDASKSWRGADAYPMKPHIGHSYTSAIASTNLPKRRGKTVLHLSAEGGNAKIVRALLEYGVDVDIRDYNGDTPLHYAARLGQVEVVDELMNEGADVNAFSDVGWTALHLAIQHQHEDVVRALLTGGAELGVRL